MHQPTAELNRSLPNCLPSPLCGAPGLSLGLENGVTDGDMPMPTARKWIWGCEHGNCWREARWNFREVECWLDKRFFFFFFFALSFQALAKRKRGKQEKGENRTGRLILVGNHLDREHRRVESSSCLCGVLVALSLGFQSELESEF